MGLLNELRQIGWLINVANVVSPRGDTVSVRMPKSESWPDYSLIIPRFTLDTIILEGALKSGAKFGGGVHVTNVAPEGDGVLVTGDLDGRSFSVRGRLVLVATGANHKLLQQMGLLKRPPGMALAARAYYENLSGLTDTFHFRFDGVPLPGYGWLFPTSASSANVGVMLWPGRGTQLNTRAAVEPFTQSPNLRPLLAGARRVSPIKGYPIRIDFATAPTFGERVLLAGEAAGLVNPLTGEGIDFALESGHLAAEHLSAMFESGDLSPERLAGYDRLLRRRYQRLFVFCHRLRKLFLNRPFLNRLVTAADRHDDLKLLLRDILLQQQEDFVDVSPATILKASLALVRAP